jgi:hypothetical protein
MKSTIWKLAFLAMLGLITQSYAIFGIGGFWAPGTGSVDGKTELINQNGSNSLSLIRGSGSGSQGFGMKIWVDAIPFVDIEIAPFVQLTKYPASVVLNTGSGSDTTNLKLEGLPVFGDTDPVFGKLVVDASIRYPFLSFPPVVSLVKLYAGAGASFISHTPFLDKELLDEIITVDDLSGSPDVNDLADKVIDKIKDDGLPMGVGGHLLLGTKFKAPIIPIALFADAKWHFGGLPEAVQHGFTFHLGAALAF